MAGRQRIYSRTTSKGERRYDVTVDHIDPDTGKRRQQRKTFTTVKEAKQFLAQHEADAARGMSVAPQRQTVAQLLHEWLDMHSPNIKPTTADQYRRTIERHIVPQLGHLPVQQLTARRIQQHYAALLGAGVGPRTVRFVHERLKQALDHARKLRMVARNEAEDATPPTMPKREMRIWDDEQIARFLDVADQSIYGPLWVLALYTGLRRGELCGLRWGDIEWEGGILHVRQSITVIGGREVVQTPKSGRQRTVSVPESLLEALKAHRTRQRAQRLRMGPVWHENDLVFTVGHGGPLHPDNIDLDFKRLIALAEVPIIRIHDLRHTHASLLLRHGEQLTVVSQRLGHTRTSVTSDVYAHVLPDQHRETAERLGRLLARKV